MEERRRLTLEEIEERHPELLPALRAHPHVGWLLVRSSEHGAVALGANGTHYLADRPRRGRGPARAVLAQRAAAPAAHRRLRARRRHHGRQLLRPGARRGLRVRGADLVPRRDRRPADAAVHPPPGAPRGAGGRSSARPACTGSSPAGGASSRAARTARYRRKPSGRRRVWPNRRSDIPRSGRANSEGGRSARAAALVRGRRSRRGS